MKNGPYILLIAPEEYPGKKYRGRYAYEHHLIWWENTGDILEEGYLLHHKNEDKHDNSFDNLEKILRSDHNALHAPSPRMMTVKCLRCDESFTKTARELKERLKKNKGKIFCGRSCQVKQQLKERYNAK